MNADVSPTIGYDELFEGITSQAFINEYFNKKPLHLNRKEPAIIEQLLDRRAFLRSLKECENVRAVFPGMMRASIAPNDAHDMYLAGATICATGIDCAVPKIAQLVRDVKSDLSYLGLVTANAYWSPPQNGFEAHIDPRIVTVVQIYGTKNWRFTGVPLAVYPLERPYDDASREEVISAHEKEHGFNEVTLNPGDLLCLPAGCPHSASAENESLSLNIAFDYAGFGIADLVARKVRDLLSEDPSMRHAPFQEYDRHAEEVLERAITLAHEKLTALRGKPDAFLRRY